MQGKLINRAAIFLNLILISSSVSAQTAQQGGGTTLANSSNSYTVPAKPYVILRRGKIEAIVVDNRSVHDDVLPGYEAGYSGLAALRHPERSDNLFLPSAGGLNFEFIYDGTAQEFPVSFEPRRAVMELRRIDEYTVELYQAPTPHWGVESIHRYHLLPDGTIEMTFECIPHRTVFKYGYIGLLWANYISRPESLDIHFWGYPIGNDRTPRWIQAGSPSHGRLSTHLASGDERVFRYDLDFRIPLITDQSTYRYSEPWYYGVSHGMAYVLMFRDRDRIRFTQSPSGGGDGSPAWDFQFIIPDYEVGQRYQMVMRAMYVPFESAEQIRRVSELHRRALNP
jgi:hypothetical protein